MRFEKKSCRVVYLEKDEIFRVTIDPVGVRNRRVLNPAKNLVGVAAAISYWDSACRKGSCLACARTVREAWNAGDRFRLDTDKARKAAELVADLAETKPDDRDICSALIDLSNAIAEVLLDDTPIEAFDVLQVCREAMEACCRTDGFAAWPAVSQRKKFMYSLGHKDRNNVMLTLMGLYFKYGSTPLVTSRQHQELVAIDRGEGVEGAVGFFDECIRKITEYKFSL